MKKLFTFKGLFLILIFVVAFTKSYGQVPILYYDFENNTTRSTFENAVEQSINTGSSPITRAGNITTVSGVGGAGFVNGGVSGTGTPGTGEAASGNNFQSSTTDPGASATNYYQFVVNTSGFSTISIIFDHQASSTGPASVGVLYSTDGTTFNTSTTSPQATGNAAFKLAETFALPAATDNQTMVTVRIYAYSGDRTGRGTFGTTGTFRIDNLTVSATSAIATKTLLDYPAIGLSIRSGVVFTPVYSNFTVNGSGITVSINGTLQLAGVLTITDGILNTADKLTLKSTATNTAIIAPVTSASPSPISGNVTVERYISSASNGGNRAYRLLAPSVNTSGSTKPFIRDNWQEGTNNPDATTNNDPVPGFGTHITGASSANGFDVTVTGQGSLFTYDQTIPNYVAVGNTNATNLNAQTGYLIYIRGDRTASNISGSATSSNTTLRATGTVLTGTITYGPLPSFNSVNDDANFSLVTNPYPSAINWNLIYNHPDNINKTNFENYYTYWDPNISPPRGGYVTVREDGTQNPIMTPVPTNFPGVNIQSGLAYFIKTKSGITTPSFTVLEADKSTTNNVDVFRTASAAEKLRVSLYYTTTEFGRSLMDGVLALYDKTYNAALDGNDAVEINNFDENIAIARAGKHLSIEERPSITGTDSLPLFINHMKQRSYEFEFNPTNLNNPARQAWLSDKFLGTKTSISLSDKSVIAFTVTPDASSSSADRFSIVFEQKVAIAPIPVITYEMGLHVYPNPVHDNLTMEMNLGKGNYVITITNKGGQQVFSKAIQHNGGSIKQTLQLPKGLTTGAYQLRLAGAGISIIKQLIKN